MQNTYIFRKNIKGGLGIELDSYDMLLPTRVFQMPNNVERVTIPHQYALGLFISPIAKKCFELGYFTIDNYDALVKEAIELGLCGEEEAPEIYQLVKIEEIIKKNDLKAIKRILKEENRLATDTLIIYAKENYGTLNQQCRAAIEQACGVDLGQDE